METVVLENSGNVVVPDTFTVYVADTSTTSVLTHSESTSFIATPDQFTVLVERDTSQLVVHGIMGPAGKDGIAEEDMVYSKRIDFVTENEIYRGEAAVGSAESSTVWRIRKVTIAGDNDVTETWASGSAAFDKAWSSRLTYQYL